MAISVLGETKRQKSNNNPKQTNKQTNPKLLIGSVSFNKRKKRERKNKQMRVR